MWKVVHSARQRLANYRPGAWLISPYTGWKWAKWPDGEVGWLPADVALPDLLRVRSRNDIQQLLLGRIRSMNSADLIRWNAGYAEQRSEAQTVVAVARCCQVARF